MEIDLIFELWDAMNDRLHYTRLLMIGMFTTTWAMQLIFYSLIASRLEKGE